MIWVMLKNVVGGCLNLNGIADVQDNGLWVKCVGTGEQQVKTTSFIKWNNILIRCKTGGAEQKRRPTYIGCTMSDNFLDFQYFVDWHREQVGYSVEGYQLDKDILFSSNKVYGEDTCVLVPRSLNMFLVTRGVSRDNCPQGVYYDKRRRKFNACVNINNKNTYIGTYLTPDAAHTAYKSSKEAEARRWYERLKSKEFIVDERVIERMRTWTLPEENCIEE